MTYVIFYIETPPVCRTLCPWTAPAIQQNRCWTVPAPPPASSTAKQRRRRKRDRRLAAGFVRPAAQCPPTCRSSWPTPPCVVRSPSSSRRCTVRRHRQHLPRRRRFCCGPSSTTARWADAAAYRGLIRPTKTPPLPPPPPASTERAKYEWRPFFGAKCRLHPFNHSVPPPLYYSTLCTVQYTIPCILYICDLKTWVDIGLQ